MNKKINLLHSLVLFAFAFITSLPLQAQENLRLVEPSAFSQRNNSNPPPQSFADNDGSNSNNDSAFRINIPPSRNKNSTLSGNVSEGNSLTQVQLQRLAAHDIVLLIDKSGSMATADCPLNGSKSTLKSLLPSLIIGGNPFNATRWQWCRQQIDQMSEQTQDALPGGFSVLLFDSGYYLFPHVTRETLPRIFERNGPGGGTDLAGPLSAVFNDYFKRQKISRVKIKPLLIGIITDGCPNQPETVQRLLTNVTHSLQDPKEVTIIFFLIGGHDSQGEHFVRDLTERLVPHGAAFNIVKGIPFQEVLNSGLARSLADNLD